MHNHEYEQDEDLGGVADIAWFFFKGASLAFVFAFLMASIVAFLFVF